jgi:hypothetical protein
LKKPKRRKRWKNNSPNETKKQTAGSELHQHQDEKVQESLKLTCKGESPRILCSRRRGRVRIRAPRRTIRLQGRQSPEAVRLESRLEQEAAGSSRQDIGRLGLRARSHRRIRRRRNIRRLLVVAD